MATGHRNQWLYYTSDNPDGTGRPEDYGRLNVEVARTSFFEGREFRTFKELNIPGSGEYVLKIVLPSDVILQSAETQVDSGWLRIGAYVGGTEGGTFSEELPRFAANGMSLGLNRRAYNGVAYAPLMTIHAGGTHTGGIETEVVRNKAAGNANQSVTVGGTVLDTRGAAAGTYYFRFLNLSPTDAATGVFRMRWEERA